MNKIIRHFILIITLMIFITSCNFPHTNEVTQTFIKENPSYSVVSVYSGEGDSDNIYFHIKYQKPESKEIDEDVWLYSKDKNGNWHVNNKEKSKIIK